MPVSSPLVGDQPNLRDVGTFPFRSFLQGRLDLTTNADFIPVKTSDPKEPNRHQGRCERHLNWERFRFVFPVRNEIVTRPPLNAYARSHRLANDHAEKIVLQDMET